MIIIATMENYTAEVLHYDFGDQANVLSDWLNHIDEYGDHFCLDDIERCPHDIDLQLIELAVADDQCPEFVQFSIEYVRNRKQIDLSAYEVRQRLAITEAAVEAWEDDDLDEFIAGNLEMA